jgi:hypothetical protein
MRRLERTRMRTHPRTITQTFARNRSLRKTPRNNAKQERSIAGRIGTERPARGGSSLALFSGVLRKDLRTNGDERSASRAIGPRTATNDRLRVRLARGRRRTIGFACDRPAIGPRSAFQLISLDLRLTALRR